MKWLCSKIYCVFLIETCAKVKYLISGEPLTFINTYCNGQKVPGQALGGTEVNNTWCYAVYMQMKQVIWVLKADVRVAVRKYNNWLWNAFSVILFFYDETELQDTQKCKSI